MEKNLAAILVCSLRLLLKEKYELKRTNPPNYSIKRDITSVYFHKIRILQHLSCKALRDQIYLF